MLKGTLHPRKSVSGSETPQPPRCKICLQNCCGNSSSPRPARHLLGEASLRNRTGLCAQELIVAWGQVGGGG